MLPRPINCVPWPGREVPISLDRRAPRSEQYRAEARVSPRLGGPCRTISKELADVTGSIAHDQDCSCPEE